MGSGTANALGSKSAPKQTQPLFSSCANTPAWLTRHKHFTCRVSLVALLRALGPYGLTSTSSGAQCSLPSPSHDLPICDSARLGDSCPPLPSPRPSLSLSTRRPRENAYHAHSPRSQVPNPPSPLVRASFSPVGAGPAGNRLSVETPSTHTFAGLLEDLCSFCLEKSVIRQPCFYPRFFPPQYCRLICAQSDAH